MRTEKGEATEGSGLLPPGAAGEKSDAGRALGEGQGIGPTGRCSWLLPSRLR